MHEIVDVPRLTVTSKGVTAGGHELVTFYAGATPTGNSESGSVEHGEVSDGIVPSVSDRVPTGRDALCRGVV